jgi:hypothetical protein
MLRIEISQDSCAKDAIARDMEGEHDDGLPSWSHGARMLAE